jgi:hypothetical protein
MRTSWRKTRQLAASSTDGPGGALARRNDPGAAPSADHSQLEPVRSTLGLHSLEQYEPLIGGATIERIAAKADRVRTMRVAHISSTFYGGGITELLTPLTLMMNAIGIETDWHLIQGTPGYFGCTQYVARREPGFFGR